MRIVGILVSGLIILYLSTLIYLSHDHSHVSGSIIAVLLILDSFMIFIFFTLIRRLKSGDD